MSACGYKNHKIGVNDFGVYQCTNQPCRALFDPHDARTWLKNFFGEEWEEEWQRLKAEKRAFNKEWNRRWGGYKKPRKKEYLDNLYL